MKDKLDGKTVTIQQDGWSIIQNVPVVASSVTCEGEVYFIDAQCTGTTVKTQKLAKKYYLSLSPKPRSLMAAKLKLW